MKQIVKRFSLSFKNRVFFMCLLATLVPLFDLQCRDGAYFYYVLKSSERGYGKAADHGDQRAVFQVVEDCENTCAELTADGFGSLEPDRQHYH